MADTCDAVKRAHQSHIKTIIGPSDANSTKTAAPTQMPNFASLLMKDNAPLEGKVHR